MKMLLACVATICAAFSAQAWTATIANYTPTPGAKATYAYVLDSGELGGVAGDHDKINNQVWGLRAALKDGALYDKGTNLSGASVTEVGNWLSQIVKEIDPDAQVEASTTTPSSGMNVDYDFDQYRAHYAVVVELFEDGTYSVGVTGWVRHTTGGSDMTLTLADGEIVHVLPEPTALALLALGVAGVALRRRVAA